MIDFDSLNSKLENTTADLQVTTLSTFCVWALADGQGEGSLGHIIALDEAVSYMRFRHHNAVDTLALSLITTGDDGIWTFPAPDLQWNAVAVSMDSSSLANDPIARVNFANVTVTETANPTLATTAPIGYCVGNNTGQLRTWDGMIAHVQIFNVILTAAEMDQSLRRPGSVRRGLKLWLPMYHAGYLGDLSGNAFTGTGTALTNRIGGPPCSQLFSARRRSYTVPVGAGRIWKLAGRPGPGLVA